MLELLPLFSRQENWQADAACDIGSAEYYFMESDTKDSRDAVRIARKICRGCPVIVECLQYAMTHKEREGVWGGLTTSERGVFAKKVSPYFGIQKDELVKTVNELIQQK